MRLIVFLTWDVSLETWREKGLLQRELKLYEALRDKGIDVVLMTWGGDEDSRIAGTIRGVTVVPVYKRLPYFKSKAARALISPLVPLFMKDLVGEDTIFKSNQMWGAWVAAVAKYLYRKPFLLRTGYELYDFTVRGGYGIARRNFIRVLSYLSYRAADHVFLATAGDRDVAATIFGVAREKITLCPNWIDTALFAPEADGAQGEESKEPALLYVGRLNAQKNLHALIDAVSRTPYRLDMVGTGELEAPLKEQAERSGAHVRFHGAAPNDSLPGRYWRCAAYILPSHYEGNPKGLLEAMSCGAAVIGTDVAGIRDAVAHGVDGYLCGTDVQSLRAAICHVMEDSGLRASMGRKARQRILENNTLEAQVAREMKCLRDLSAASAAGKGKP